MDKIKIPLSFYRYDLNTVLRGLLPMPHGYYGIWLNKPEVLANDRGAVLNFMPNVSVQTSGVSYSTVVALMNLRSTDGKLTGSAFMDFTEPGSYIRWLTAMTKD